MKSLAICDDVPEYARRLKKCLVNKREFPFEIVIYDSLEVLMDNENNCKQDIFLIKEEILKENWNIISEFTKGKLIVALTNENVYENDLTKIPYVYRYQPGKIICNRILEVVSDNLLEISGIYNSDVVNNTVFIGVYSPVAKNVQEEFAFYLGKAISENKKVLYMNLNLFPIQITEELYDENQKNITDLVFAAACSKDNFCLKMDSMKVCEENLDYIKGVSDFADVLGIEENDWEELMNQIEKSRKYDVVVINFEESINGFISILNKCKRVFSIYDNDENSLEILSKYKESIKRNYEDVYEKSEFILLPEDIALNRTKNLRRSNFQKFVKKVKNEMVKE